MSEWAIASLSDVADRVTTKNVDRSIHRVMTVSAAHGLIDQDRFFNKKVASADLSTYYVLQPGDYVYNKSTSKDAEFGVVARLALDEPAVVTPLYIPFRARRDRVDPDFLLLACNGALFFQSLAGRLREGARAHGLLNVRLGEFFSASVPLPPLPEQRRIVDVMAAVDASVEALEVEITTLGNLWRAGVAELGGVEPHVEQCLEPVDRVPGMGTQAGVPSR
jgi:type I restriction enzyme, S subunit